jgi:starvation-inducible DNA-binding protein
LRRIATSQVVCRSRLNDVLADTQVLHALYKNCQWALPPSRFHSLHELVVWHAREQMDLADLIAARIRDVNGVALADPRRISMRTDIAQPPDNGESVPYLIRRLIQAHDTISIRAHNTGLTVGEHGDEASRATMVLVGDVNNAQAQTISQYLAQLRSTGSEPAVSFEPPIALAFVDVRSRDVVDEWGRQSFPASDPPANW